MTEKFYTSLFLLIINLFFAYNQHKRNHYKLSALSFFIAGLIFGGLLIEI